MKPIAAVDELRRRAAAQTADAVIFIAAAHRFSEGMDLREMELPDGQNEAIDALVRANPNVAVVLVPYLLER